MNIAYLHGLESSIDPKDPKIIWLNNNFKTVYTPSINYRDPSSFDKILRKIKAMNPQYIVGSSVGGYFAYLIGSKLGINTILFNPAVVDRSFNPKVNATGLKGANHSVFLGKSDTTISGTRILKYFSKEGVGLFNTKYYTGGHRVPADIFINSIQKVTGINEIYNKNKYNNIKI